MASTFVEIVAERDAAVPELDFTRACPEAEVDRVGRLKHETESGDMNTARHKQIKY